MSRPHVKNTLRPTGRSPRVRPPRHGPPARTANKVRIKTRTRLQAQTPAAKRKAVELKAETATRNKLYRLGYQSVRRMQHNKLHGLDLGAIKYDKRGKVISGAIVEVKGRSGATPGPSAFKKQVRESYVTPRLALARQKGIKGADEMYRLAKDNKVTRYGSTYGLVDKGKGPRIYKVPRRGPISKKPI